MSSPSSMIVFEQVLERMRRKYDFFICGYVVMPEHVHLLLSEPAKGTLASALQAVKQAVSRKLSSGDGVAFWQERYYDFNVFSESKRIEKLRYMHRNPVKRGLVPKPEDWPWGSFHHYLSGENGAVEIESKWTAQRRERSGQVLTVKLNDPAMAKPDIHRTGPNSQGAPS